MSGNYSAARDDNRVPTISGLSSSDLITPLSPKVIASTNRLAVDSVTDVNSTSIVQDGTKTIAVGGTAERLVASSVPCKKVTVYAYVANTTTVAVGTSTVVAENGGKNGRGEQLLQGAATSVYISDATNLWLNAATAGDGVSFIVYT